MNRLQHLAVKLGLTRAEMIAVTVFLALLVTGGTIRYGASTGDADRLLKAAEANRYSEAQVDSLLRLAATVDYAAESQAGRSFEEASTSGEEEASPRHSVSRSSKKRFTGTIPFNAATPAQLQQISGIGPVMAKRLIAFRSEKGGKVKQFDDFLEVKGIGRKKLEVLKKHLTLE